MIGGYLALGNTYTLVWGNAAELAITKFLKKGPSTVFPPLAQLALSEHRLDISKEGECSIKCLGLPMDPSSWTPLAA